MATMDETLASDLRRLLTGRNVGALGTLHDGAPFVSMVPYALLGDGAAVVVHVSGLAAHTQDMRDDPRVSLLVMAAESPEVAPQVLPRVTIQGRAVEAPRSSPERAAAAEAYLARFPHAAPMLDLGDFTFFTIVPESARWVGGFAQARTVAGEALGELLRAPA